MGSCAKHELLAWLLPHVNHFLQRAARASNVRRLPPSEPYRAVWFGVKEQQLDLLRTALCCACELLPCIDTVQRKGV